MSERDELVLVLGATGQQGGATARALRADGWRVRALVRDVASAKARALAAAGVELVRGDMRDRASLAAAAGGAYGVFSVQPSSLQLEYGVTDEDELRIGTTVADVAKAAGVAHLVYTSVAGTRAGTGIGHFESKWRIEQHIRGLGIAATVVRPSAFMELFLLPSFGGGQGTLLFFVGPERLLQVIAAEDIGVIAARVFAQPEAYVGQGFDIAGDRLTGHELATRIARATGRPTAFARFPDAVLEQQPVLRRLVEVAGEDGYAHTADLAALRRLHPGLLTVDAWLDRSGRAAFDAIAGA